MHGGDDRGCERDEAEGPRQSNPEEINHPVSVIVKILSQPWSPRPARTSELLSKPT